MDGVAVSRGIVRERQVRAMLEQQGYWVARAAGSLGDADLIALKAGQRPILVEVKSTTRSAFADFGPADRAELLAAAEKAGADAVLIWWPPRREPTWWWPRDWPADRRGAA